MGKVISFAQKKTEKNLKEMFPDKPKTIQEKNKANQERMRKEMAKANDDVLKSYGLKDNNNDWWWL